MCFKDTILNTRNITLKNIFVRNRAYCKRICENKIELNMTLINLIEIQRLNYILINYCSDDRHIFTFFKSVPMSTYLVALVVSDFKFKSELGRINLAVYARPNAINQTDYALSVMSPLLRFFEDTYQQKYQLPKLFMIALPDFGAGAMENWGLLTYREASMLYDRNHSSITNQQDIRNVIAHEISHQWFGNLVSPQWWKYLWLNEGFARYFEYHAPAIVRKN